MALIGTSAGSSRKGPKIKWHERRLNERERCEGEISPAVAKNRALKLATVVARKKKCLKALNLRCAWRIEVDVFLQVTSCSVHTGAQFVIFDNTRRVSWSLEGDIRKCRQKCLTMETYCVLTYQYSVTVNDSVEPVSNGEDRTLLKLVPDSLLDEAVSSKGAGNTTPQHKKNSS